MPNDTGSLPEIRPVPEGPDGKRVALIALAVIVAVGLFVLGGLVLFGGRKQQAQELPKTYEPAQETTAGGAAGPSVGSTSSSGQATASPVATASPQAGGGAERVAYRLGDTLYVANDDGTAASAVARVPEGEYALSPDGKTLAVTHDARLTLYDVATGAPVELGGAATAKPVWYPDSSALLFARSTRGSRPGAGITDIWFVRRDGKGETCLQRGSSASISPNGRIIAAVGIVDPGVRGQGAVYVSRDGGAFRTVRISSGTPVSVAAADKGIYVSLSSAGEGSRILRMALDGTGQEEFSGRPDSDVPTSWQELLLSPDGTSLAAAARGDDEYCRISLFRLSDRHETRLSKRRDTYLRQWSPSGDCLLVIEGNAYQAESTNLLCVLADGSSARNVVTGAR